MRNNNYIVYIGDFDFRNENVQSFLVKNNGKIFRSLGLDVAYIGINTKETNDLKESEPLSLPLIGDDKYLELPSTLNMSGIFKYHSICTQIVEFLNKLSEEAHVGGVITYQSPTYAVALRTIAKWCIAKGVPYIVNCADLPIFTLQSPLRKIVMKINWDYMHKINIKYAQGVISVSRYIENFYRKSDCQYIIVPPLFDSDNQMQTRFKANKVATFIYAGIPFKITGHEAIPSGMKDRLDKVLDLFALLTEKSIPYEFQIVGIDKNDYLQGVPRHKAVLENNDSVVFLGRRSHQETLDLVSRADFSINYRDENLMTKAGFSTKIVESVSLGTPVIINDISDTFLYIKEGISGFQLSGNLITDCEKLTRICALSEVERKEMKKELASLKVFDIHQFKYPMKTFLESLQIKLPRRE